MIKRYLALLLIIVACLSGCTNNNEGDGALSNLDGLETKIITQASNPPFITEQTIPLSSLLASVEYESVSLIECNSAYVSFIIEKDEDKHFITVDIYNNTFLENRLVNDDDYYEICVGLPFVNDIIDRLPVTLSAQDIIMANSLGRYAWAATKDKIYIIDENERVSVFEADEGVYCIVSNENLLAYQSANSLHLLYLNQPLGYSVNFTDDEKENISWRLTETDLFFLCRDGDNLYYYEMSDFAHRPLQMSDIVVWCYNAETGVSSEIESFSEILFTVDIDFDEREIIFDNGYGNIYTVPFK